MGVARLKGLCKLILNPNITTFPFSYQAEFQNSFNKLHQSKEYTEGIAVHRIQEGGWGQILTDKSLSKIIA